MKKSTQKKKKKGSRKRSATLAVLQEGAAPNAEALQEKAVDRKLTNAAISKKEPERRGEAKGSPMRYFNIAVQFLREAKMELKKVKRPTRKELLASTAVVIVLVLVVSFFLGLIDFGLIKIIKNIVG